MAEPAKKVAQQTEDRLENLAETVREKFDKVDRGDLTGTGSSGAGSPTRRPRRATRAEPRRNAKQG